jgi:phosphotriesterase-related protein
LGKWGCFLAFDNFGSETQNEEWGIKHPIDEERIASVVELVRRGFLSQILIFQDLSFKTSLRRFGGQGYDHILRTVVPKLKKSGLNDDQISTILIENPKRLLCFLS